MRKAATLLLFICFSGKAPAQSAEKMTLLQFIPYWKENVLTLNKTLRNGPYSNDSLKIETLRFYISSVAFLNDTTVVWKENNSYHLIDAETANIVKCILSKDILYNRISFNLGIDSITNAGGAGSGDLDATKGMYWAWQSGYINFKLEGTCLKVPARKNEFQFHTGGFRGEDYCMQKVVLDVSKKDTINIAADIAVFFEQVDLQKQYSIMMPGKQAADLSAIAAQIFSIRQK